MSTAPANIRVLVRVRPLNNSEKFERGAIGRSNVLNIEQGSSHEIDFDGGVSENGKAITVNPVNANASNTGGYNSDNDFVNSNGKQYMFDAVHGEDSRQEEVYDSVKGIVDAVVDGYNGTIVAYGQTGSGKTFTVFGGGKRYVLLDILQFLSDY